MEIDMDTNESNFKDEENFLISMERTLSSVENSMEKFVQDVPQALSETGFKLELKDIKIESRSKFQTLFRACPESYFSDQKNRKDEKDERIAALENQLHNQMDETKRAREEIEYLKEEILKQSTYCTNLGAVLANLTWRASKCPEIVDVWLSKFQHRIGEVLKIVDGSFIAFINIYGNSFPPTSNVEYQFIISLLGIVTNISACPEGREFFITYPNGKIFVQKIIKLMPTLPLSQGSLWLKRLMLMMLYNLSMNKTGLEHLLESRIGTVLNYYLELNSIPEEIELYCLRLFRSITYELTNPKYIEDLFATVSISKIEDIANSNKSDLSSTAKQVIKHLREARKYLHSN